MDDAGNENQGEPIPYASGPSDLTQTKQLLTRMGAELGVEPEAQDPSDYGIRRARAAAAARKVMQDHHQNAASALELAADAMIKQAEQLKTAAYDMAQTIRQNGEAMLNKVDAHTQRMNRLAGLFETAKKDIGAESVV